MDRDPSALDRDLDPHGPDEGVDRTAGRSPQRTRLPERADAVVVLAEEPRPGRVKTRLQRQFSAVEAARLATAALQDTLDAVRATPLDRRLLALDGDPGGWSTGFEVTAQPPGPLGDRLAAAFAAAWADDRRPRPARTLLVGMDTPQLRVADLRVDWAGADAVLGLAEHGGFWAIGLQPGCPAGIFDGVPMSTARTGAAQLARLFDLGLTIRLLPPRRDVDLPEDAEAVATAHPELAFSRCWRAIVHGRPEQSCDRLFDQVYTGHGGVRSGTVSDPSDDRSLLLEVARWTADADAVDELVVARCESPVIDLGCGPGRMVRALLRSGRVGLGVDMSAGAVSTSLSRGSPALRRLVDDPLPAEGRWGTALLMDSNLGIGGDAVALLRRCRELVAPGGLIICEVDPDPERHEVQQVVLRTDDTSSLPMAWARVGAAALMRLAARLDLILQEEWIAGDRAFVALRRA